MRTCVLETNHVTHASIISRRVQTPRNGNTRIAPAQPSSTATQPPSPQRPPPCAFRPSNNPKRGVTRYQDQRSARGAISHIKRSGPQQPKPRASWSHPLQSLFTFLLLLLVYPQRESLFPPPPHPATPRHSQSERLVAAPLPYPRC